MLRMRNGTSKSPFRPRLSRQPIMPRPPCGRCWTRQKDAESNIAHKWLDGVSDVLADFLRRLREEHPSATAKIRPDLRLPGTTGLRFALPGRQRRTATGRVLPLSTADRASAYSMQEPSGPTSRIDRSWLWSCHSATINEGPVETKRTANRIVCRTAALSGYTDERVSPPSVG